MTQEQESALRSLYLMTGIPFSVVGYDGSVIHSQPASYGKFLRKEAVREPEDTLSESEHPEGITILEFPGGFHQAIGKIDEKRYFTTALLPSSKDLRFPLNHLTKLIRAEHLKEYISLITSLPQAGIPELINYARMLKFSLTGEWQQGVNYYKARNPGEEITPIEKPRATDYQREASAERTFRLKEQLEELFRAVKEGNEELVSVLLSEPDPLEKVKFSEETLRDTSYKAVVQLTTAMRGAMAAGVPEHPAVQLLSESLRTIDLMSEELAIIRYLNESIQSFAKLVCKARADEGRSPYTVKAIAYIRAHLYENISIDEVAEHCLINRSSLSEYFRRDTGETIAAFILSEKLERGYQLLKDSDMPISEISSLLCFATQSHFTQRLREKYGTTPKQLRLRSSHKA